MGRGAILAHKFWDRYFLATTRQPFKQEAGLLAGFLRFGPNRLQEQTDSGCH